MTTSSDVKLLSQPRVETRSLLRNVYLYMLLAMTVTAGASWFTLSSGLIKSLGSPWILFGIFIVQLILVGTLAFALPKLSVPVAFAIFFAYAAVTGFTLSSIFIYYDIADLTMAFASAGALFLVMSLVGVFTKADLTKLGTYLFIGLIGIIIAMVINIFLRSSMMDLIISIIGVIIFTGLTAHDTQKIVQMSRDPRIQGSEGSLLTKLSIMGALALYLDFLNLFLFLLRIFGRNN
jgi:FtsH-binding integral membrane protein